MSGDQLSREIPFRDGAAKVVARTLAALAFVAVGIEHFRNEAAFLAIMPPWIPFHRFCVLFSGAAEIAGGVGLLVPRLRRAAGFGLLALLVAVYPANIHMALNQVQIPGMPEIPAWAAWARLPFQFAFAAIVWWVALARPRSSSS